MTPILTRDTETPLPALDTTSSPPGGDRYPRRLVRFAPEVVRELPDESLLRVDINGCLAGSILAIADAPRELAAGWAFVHGFFDSRNELGRITVDGSRISVMVESGGDIERRRLEAVGWAEQQPLPVPEMTDQEPFRIGEAQLIAMIDATWDAFRRDGGRDGYVHAGVAAGSDVKCIARDCTSDMAVVKALGWTLLDAAGDDISVLMVKGIVGRRVVEAAARIGISLIVTSAILTAEGFRAALGLSLSVIGMATSKSMGLLVDGGHIEEWTSTETCIGGREATSAAIERRDPAE